MPRTARIAPGGVIYHVVNRSVGGMKFLQSDQDYLAFLRALTDTAAVVPMRILAFCIMPNHWHLILWPYKDGDLARFMLRLTITHVRRWIEYRKHLNAERSPQKPVHQGHLYQGRYKSFAMESDEHLWTVGRYVERNALRAGLAKRAEHWRWSSIGQHILGETLRIPLSEWPTKRRADWIDWVNRPQTAVEEEAIRRCLRDGRPFGSEPWMKQMTAKLGWREQRKAGRPRKIPKARK